MLYKIIDKSQLFLINCCSRGGNVNRVSFLICIDHLRSGFFLFFRVSEPFTLEEFSFRDVYESIKNPKSLFLPLTLTLLKEMTTDRLHVLRHVSTLFH